MDSQDVVCELKFREDLLLESESTGTESLPIARSNRQAFRCVEQECRIAVLARSRQGIVVKGYGSQQAVGNAPASEHRFSRLAVVTAAMEAFVLHG